MSSSERVKVGLFWGAGQAPLTLAALGGAEIHILQLNFMQWKSPPVE